MEKTRQTATMCVGRAVMFAALAIVLLMLSFAFDPVRACRAGGILTLVLSAILIWYAQTAQRRRPKDTETWPVLAEAERPNGEYAVRLFAQVMEDVYLYFARQAFAVAAALLTASLLLAIFGVGATSE